MTMDRECNRPRGSLQYEMMHKSMSALNVSTSKQEERERRRRSHEAPAELASPPRQDLEELLEMLEEASMDMAQLRSGSSQNLPSVVAMSGSQRNRFVGAVLSPNLAEESSRKGGPMCPSVGSFDFSDVDFEVSKVLAIDQARSADSMSPPTSVEVPREVHGLPTISPLSTPRVKKKKKKVLKVSAKALGFDAQITQSTSTQPTVREALKLWLKDRDRREVEAARPSRRRTMEFKTSTPRSTRKLLAVATDSSPVAPSIRGRSDGSKPHKHRSKSRSKQERRFSLTKINTTDYSNEDLRSILDQAGISDQQMASLRAAGFVITK